MSVEIIRVGDPEAAGWPQWAAEIAQSGWEFAKERPQLALVAAPFVIVAAPFIATTALTVGGTAAGAAAVIGSMEYFRPTKAVAQKAEPKVVEQPKFTSAVTVYTPQEAEGMIDVFGQPLVQGPTYMRHPKRSQRAEIIKSNDFHSYIMGQKVSEIIDYMRAETRLLSLKILIRSNDKKHAYVGGMLQAVPVKANLDIRSQRERRMELSYDNPVRIPRRGPYVWMGDFPEVVSATRHVRGGTISFSQATDMSFGLSAQAAKIASFNVGWLSTFVIEIEATFV